ncbi:MAG: methyltransferase domain-containing protein [Polyangiales bacterium]
MDIRALQDYQTMMADDLRMQAYAQAIAALCPDKIVVEIGVGLGPLSLMALRAGARRVYGIELNPDALALASEVIAAHGFGPARFVPVPGLSTEVALPEKADVILSETLDSLGIGENTAHYMADAKARLLQPGGAFIPARLECHLALAAPAAYAARAHFWQAQMRSQHGLDYRAVLPALRRVKHTLPIDDSERLSDWQCWQCIDFSAPERPPQTAGVVLSATRSGTATGLAAAFVAWLSPEVQLRTFCSDAPTHWQQGFVPFPERALEVALGKSVYAEFALGQTRDPALRYALRVAAGPASQVEALAAQRRSSAGLS